MSTGAPRPVRITNDIDVSVDHGCLGWALLIAAVTFIAFASTALQIAEDWRRGDLPPIPIVIVTPAPVIAR